MNCREAESLLEALAAGELAPGEAVEVERHVAGCERCRRSLETWRALEQALVARSSEVPPASLTIAAIAPALRRKRWTPVFDVLFSVPGIASLILLAAAVFFRIGGETLSSAIGRAYRNGDPALLSLAGLARAITERLAATDATTLAFWIAGVSALLISATTAAIVRLLRD